MNDEILRTWQDEVVGNVAPDHPLEIGVHLPQAMLSVASARVLVMLKEHRIDTTSGFELGPVASGVTVAVNGRDRTTELGGPFDSNFELDLTRYLGKGANTVTLGSRSQGRLQATVFVQVRM
jgi:hypothetical protein